MLQKKQLASMNPNHNKRITQFNIPERDKAGFYNFQRDKQEVVEQLLNHQCIQKVILHDLMVKNSGECSGSILNKNQQLFWKGFEKEQPTQEKITMLSTHQKQPPVHLNEYIELNKNVTKDTQKQKRSRKSDEQYEFLDNFIKNKAKAISGEKKKTECKSVGVDNIFYDRQSNISNQSTNVLSKFFKPDASPHRKIRKTEIFDCATGKAYSKDISNQGQSSKAQTRTFKSQFIVTNTEKNQNYEEKDYKDTIEQKNSNQSERFFSKIPAKTQQQLHKFHSNCQPRKDRQSKKSVATEREKNHSQSDKVKKITIDLSHLQRPQRQIQPLPQIQIISNFDEEQQTGKPYDYDQESNIFTKIDNKKEISPQQLKELFKNAKAVFGVKNESQLNKQVEIANSLTRKISRPSKPKSDLFTGCAQISYQKHLKNLQNQPTPQQDKKANQINSKDDLSIQTVSLKKEQQISSKVQQDSAKKDEQLKDLHNCQQNVNVAQSNQAKELNLNKQTWKQLSKVSSQSQILKSDSQEILSCSFFRQKEEVNDQQISAVNKMVNDTIKTVELNLQKVENKQQPNDAKQICTSKKSSSQVKSGIVYPIEASKQKQPSKDGEYKKEVIQKIFGTSLKSKLKQEGNENFNFFQRLPNFDAASNPSTVKKIDSKSDERSEMMKHIKDLQECSVGSQIFKKCTSQINVQNDHNQDHELKEAESKILDPSQLNNPLQSLLQAPPHQNTLHVNIEDLKDYDFSQDAISFSKLSNATSKNQHLSPPSIPQEQQQQKQKQLREKDQNLEISNNDKIKRIEIESDSHSSDHSIVSQYEEEQKKMTDDEEVNLDELQNYESDEEQSPKLITKKVDRVQPTILTPVIEQELQQSEFQKKILSKKSESIKLPTVENEVSKKITQQEQKVSQDSFLKHFQKKYE